MASASSADFVLPLAAERELELIPVCIAAVPPQKVAAVVKAVTVALGPTPELQHLKRVRQPASGSASEPSPKRCPEMLQVLLWAGGPDEQGRIPASLTTALREMDIQLAQGAAPRHAPVTLAQHEQWSRVWPLAFHPSAALRALAPWAPETALSTAELQWMTVQMRRAIAIAEQAVLTGGRPVGALISVPLGEALAACSDGAGSWLPSGAGDLAPGCGLGAAGGSSGAVAIRGVPSFLNHPLQHALMQCIGVVADAARRRRDGAARSADPSLVGCKRGADGIGAQTGTSRNSPPASSGLAASDPGMSRGGAGAGQGECGCGCSIAEKPALCVVDAVTDAVCAAASASPFAPAGAPPADELYLCSGCDVFVTVEPCAMCAMGLIHSRIRRLVYALPAADGALGSKYRLHTAPSINHHYQVVRGFLREEAAERLERAGAGQRQGADRMAG